MLKDGSAGDTAVGTAIKHNKKGKCWTARKDIAIQSKDQKKIQNICFA